MPILAWFVPGLIGCLIGSLIVNKHGEGLVGDLFLGVNGAVVGGWAFYEFGHWRAIGIDVPTLVVSAASAAVALIAYHAVRGARFDA